MKKFLQLFVFLMLVAAVAMGSCLLTRHLFPVYRLVQEPGDAHLWIHDQLGLTAEQDRQLHPLEERYKAEQTHLMELIHLANMELGQAILEDNGASPQVNAAIGKIHAAQGKLQMLTLEHVFEMKPILTPEQYQKLLNLTANALYQIDQKR